MSTLTKPQTQALRRPARREIDLCLANPWFYPVVVGPGERFRRYAPGLRKRGVKLRVVTVQHSGLERREVIDGIQIDRIPIRGRSRWQERTFIYRLLPLFRSSEGRPQVLQFFGYTPWNIPFLLLARLLGIPTVLVFTMLGSPEGSGFRGWLGRKGRRWLFEAYDCVVTSSGVMTEELRAVGVSRTR